MNEAEPASLTEHALLVVWGQFAQCLGLIRGLSVVSLHQKTVQHSPQTKVVEFLVAILAGLPHLKDISRSAHPLDQDPAVAKAWGQAAWADYSGVSRTLTSLSADEAHHLVQVLDRVSQPFIDREVTLAYRDQGRLVYDGDLTARSVSNTSVTYPNVAYGHMTAGVGLGYQIALVSLHSPTYGRLWLSAVQHPGDTVSCTQAQALVAAAEAKTGRRPLRRTALLQQRLDASDTQQQWLVANVAQSEAALAQAEADLHQVRQQLHDWQECVARYEAHATPGGERPHSNLAGARAKVRAFQGRQTRSEHKVGRTQDRLAGQRHRAAQGQAAHDQLQQHLAQLEHDNATNVAPLPAIFRLDAGFGSRANLIWLIEMGYEVYLKPQDDWLTVTLKKQVTTDTVWTAVGHNAEMLAWSAVLLHKIPYPLDVALERFHTGPTLQYGTLIHFGADPVTTDLRQWFQRYNGRQTIEAGIKEGKQIFEMHHLKVRSAPALYLQEQFALFAANFVRWAAHWVETQCVQTTAVVADSVKAQVTVAAHTSARVTWYEQGCLLTFTAHSLFAGQSLTATAQCAFQLPLPWAESRIFAPV